MFFRVLPHIGDHRVSAEAYTGSDSAVLEIEFATDDALNVTNSKRVSETLQVLGGMKPYLKEILVGVDLLTRSSSASDQICQRSETTICSMSEP